MPDGPHMLAFLVAAAVIVAVPGPSVLFTIGRALSAGRRDALLTVAGNALGLVAQAGLVAVGLGALLATSATAYTTVKLAGAAYLVYLGVSAIRHRGDLAAALTQPSPMPLSGRRSLGQGLVVGLTNPKSLVFLSSLLPQFTDRSQPLHAQILALGAIFAALAAAGDSAWAITASQARQWLGRSPARVRGIGTIGGVLLVGLGVGVAFTGQHS